MNHAPEDPKLVKPAVSDEIVDLLVVYRLREEEVCADRRHGRQSTLQPEDHTPGRVCDNDPTNKGTEGGTDECAGQEPAHGGSSFRWPVNVANDGCPDQDERSPLERRQDSEYIESYEIRSQGGAYAAPEEGNCRHDCDLHEVCQ